MATIVPTLTLVSNSSSHATPGPLSIALSLSATDALDVTAVSSKIVDITATHQAIWTASDYFTTAANFGVDGAFMYFKNTLSDNASPDLLHDICIGTANADLDTADLATRWFTLQPGEFAWVPYDLTNDIYADGQEANTGALECWLFVRTTTS